jgi:hypothetical protein
MRGFNLRFVIVFVLLIAYTVVPAYDAFACGCKSVVFSGTETAFRAPAGYEFYADAQETEEPEVAGFQDYLCPICQNTIDKANKADLMILTSLIQKIKHADITFVSTQYYSIYKPPRTFNS